jgi:outer membrane murein-binding lipoprotein Lpp
MKKATIIGPMALLALSAALFAAPALSNSSGNEVTIRGLARQVNALSSQVKVLRRRVAAARTAAGDAQETANTAQETANTALSTAERLDGCLGRVLPVTRYGDFVGTDAALIFTTYDPDVLGYVPTIVAGRAFNFTAGLDVSSPGGPVSYYAALVEPSCAGGYRFAQRQRAVAR